MAWERGRKDGGDGAESADVDCAPSGGTSPWERHPDTDELLYILEGRADVTILHDDGPVVTPVGAGSVIVVPRGLWHRHTVHGTVKELYLTPGRSEHSTAEDPRR